MYFYDLGKQLFEELSCEIRCRQVKPSEVRLHKRTRLSFDYLSILKCFLFYVY